MRTHPSPRLIHSCFALVLLASSSSAALAVQQVPSAFGNSAARTDSQSPIKPAEPQTLLRPATESSLKPQAAPLPLEAGRKDASAKAGATKVAQGLFAMDDQASVVVDGKQTTAAQAKKAIHAALAAKSGPPKTVQGGARKLDLAALSVSASAAGARTPAQRTMDNNKGGPRPMPVSQSTTTATSSTQAALAGSMGRKNAISNGTGASTYSARCLDSGPPVISEVEGRLKPGGKVTVWGQCFGERAGHVEIIGQFPGGKLTSAFTAWDHNGVELEIAANIRGATDHAVAVTIVTADGKRSPAMQAQFVAARERVEVPDRLWSPSSGLDLSATATTQRLVDPYEDNAAYAGHTAKTLRVQPQCSLEAMDATVAAGAITGIRGWEQGPPNEASVTIDWVGTCVGTKLTVNTNYIVGETTSLPSINSACRVAFQARAWAYCPAGVAP